MTWIYAITRYSTLLLNISTFGLGGNTISVLYLQAVVAAELIFCRCRGTCDTFNIAVMKPLITPTAVKAASTHRIFSF